MTIDLELVAKAMTTEAGNDAALAADRLVQVAIGYLAEKPFDVLAVEQTLVKGAVCGRIDGILRVEGELVVPEFKSLNDRWWKSRGGEDSWRTYYGKLSSQLTFYHYLTGITRFWPIGVTKVTGPTIWDAGIVRREELDWINLDLIAAYHPKNDTACTDDFNRMCRYFSLCANDYQDKAIPEGYRARHSHLGPEYDSLTDYSSYSVWQKCPKRYWFNYLAGPEATGIEPIEDDKTAADTGRAMHAGIAEYLRQRGNHYGTITTHTGTSESGN